MKTLQSTTLALLVGATLSTGSALAASSYWNSLNGAGVVSHQAIFGSVEATARSAPFDVLPSFAMLNNEGEVSHEAIFGPVKTQQFASKVPDYIGTSLQSSRSYWDTVPDNH